MHALATAAGSVTGILHAIVKLLLDSCQVAVRDSSDLNTAVTPEEPRFAVLSKIRLHSLKAAYSIMQGLCSRMHRDISKGFNNRLAPALSIYVLN